MQYGLFHEPNCKESCNTDEDVRRVLGKCFFVIHVRCVNAVCPFNLKNNCLFFPYWQKEDPVDVLLSFS